MSSRISDNACESSQFSPDEIADAKTAVATADGTVADIETFDERLRKVESKVEKLEKIIPLLVLICQRLNIPIPAEE
jgi:hypothetical protein